MKHNNQTLLGLINTLPIWGWPHLFRRFDNKTLLVAENQFLEAYQNKHHHLKCHVLGPADGTSLQVPSDVKTIVVFLRRGEMRLVRSLRAKYPDRDIFSVQYDLVPNCLSWPAKLPSHAEIVADNTSVPVFLSDIKLIVATPCSDAEYLALWFESRGSGRINDAFARPLFYLLDYVEDFQPARYLARLVALHGDDGQFSALLPVDIVFQLLDKTSLSMMRFLAFLKRKNVKILYLKRRDKIVQSVLLELVLRKRFRSIWMVAPEKRAAMTRNASVSAPKAVTHVIALNRAEKQIDKMLAGVDDIVSVDLEQIKDNVDACLPELWRMMGFKDNISKQECEPMSYEDCYRSLGGFAENIRQVQRELIDRTGLHLYSQGKTGN